MVQTNYKVIVRSELRSERSLLKNKGSHGRGVIDEKELKRILKAHDVDGDGWLSKNELKEAFRKLGSRFPALRAALALNHADANNDGYISDGELDQLVKYIVNHGFACY
ncbi:hypothetical protein FEM48_Zijuj06G0146300 [Ziziphus jujuba var. spinosa]|uniref:EF-hand domain-containing protein n=1 Tax=Ziziphus jujuba var. spinosa TaxID=714518 RepID=A0A978V9V4_ZIZJJ|nr:hypothetical protein FEM48_Zijuj06G0146300 [Ziziphus jujuba var. spinosa]